MIAILILVLYIIIGYFVATIVTVLLNHGLDKNFCQRCLDYTTDPEEPGLAFPLIAGWPLAVMFGLAVGTSYCIFSIAKKVTKNEKEKG